MNGNLMATTSPSPAWNTILGGYFKVGSFLNYGTTYYGMVDELAIWNTVLTQAQIQTIYSRQSVQYSGTFTSRVFDGSIFSSSYNWFSLNSMTTLPFYKELPDSATSESSSTYSGLSSGLMNGLIGLWHLDEPASTTGASSVIDYSGQGNHGTPTSVTFGQSGVLSSAAQFNSSSWPTAKIITNFKPFDGKTAFTMSTWVNISSSTATIADVIGDEPLFKINVYQFSNPPAQDYVDLVILMNTTNCSAYQSTYIQYHVPTNSWNHLLLVFDGSKDPSNPILNMYFNGVSSAMFTHSTGTLTAQINNCNGSTKFVMGDVETTQPFSGSLDEVAIWNRALSAQEAFEVYRRGANRIKYQVRICGQPDCSDNLNWIGPDGSNQTYFSELNNNLNPVDAGDVYVNAGDLVLNSLPRFNFSSFGSIVPGARYFQYRSILESDDTSLNCSYSGINTWCSPEIQKMTVVPK